MCLVLSCPRHSQEVSEQDDKLRAANEVGARLAAQCAHIQQSVDDDWDATKTRCADELNALEHEQAELQKKFSRMGTLAEQKV